MDDRHVFPTDQGSMEEALSGLFSAASLPQVDRWLRAQAGELSSESGAAYAGRHDARMLSLVRAAATLRRYVGVMGGHAFGPQSIEYASTLRLGRGLREGGFAVATGGGPGAMAAANEGASAAHRGAIDLRAPWSLGVSTLAYAQEPPNAHAHGQARFFSKELRDAALAEACSGGLVFTPGSAGTFQELFTHVCHNHYCEPRQRRPLVLWGSDFWRGTGILVGLERLVAARPQAHLLFVVDEVSKVVDLLLAHRAPRNEEAER